jgi:hypothetical protein
MTFFLLFIVVIITFIFQANVFLLCFLHYEKTEYTFQKFIQTMNSEFDSLKQLRNNYPEMEPEERKSIRNKLLN